MNIKELFERALALHKYLATQQQDAVQNMLVQFNLNDSLSPKQGSFLEAIVKTGEFYRNIDLEVINEKEGS